MTALSPPHRPSQTPADPDVVLARLTDEQRLAAEAVRGPVAILAGAGTGKTTTVTHRIAWQVASGTFEARQILAVTFTDKAAGELRHRLAELGVHGVEARTFHGAARWMLSVLWPQYGTGPLPQLLPHKIALLEELVRGLPAPDCFRPRRELAQEIEWAKNRRVRPEDYLAELRDTGHVQPLRDADRMRRIYTDYEAAKERLGAWDFEDLLWKLADLLDEHPEAAERLRTRFRSLTVDEYQDVNPLQHALLDHWVGAEQDVCVVGDDYQTIYAFTGASPGWLLEFPDRFPDGVVVRLQTSFRSTPPVLKLANQLTPHLGGFEKRLVAAGGAEADAPAPVVEALPTRADEARWVAARCRELHEQQGVAWDEMAVLYRINARSPEFESAMTDAGVPFVVRSGAFLDRPGPRGVLRGLDHRRADAAVFSAVRAMAERLGWREDGTASGNSDDAQTLQEDLARLVSMAEDPTLADVGAYVDLVRERFAVRIDQAGVELLTMHRAKGLEWDAVFLPRLNDKELPFRSRTSAADPDDERRLLYVGITRARRHLALTRAADAGAASPFLVELGVLSEAAAAATAGRTRSAASGAPRVRVELDDSDPVVAGLREWRRSESARQGKPAYVVFDDKTIGGIAAARPTSMGMLLEVSGVGPTKLERYGDAVLDVVRGALADD